MTTVKPTNDPKPLVEIVESVIASGNASLPVMHADAVRAQAMLASGEFDIEELAELIGRDAAVAVALARYANSSFYRGLEKAVSVRDAVMRLGARRSAEILMVLAQREQYRVRHPVLRTIGEKLWQHSVAVATAAGWIVGRLRLAEVEDQAVLAGLLHDTGKLLVVRVLDEIAASQDLSKLMSNELVNQAIDQLHCEYGAKLLHSWGIPDSLVEVSRRHHDNDLSEDDLLLLVVRVADEAANTRGLGVSELAPDTLASSAEASALGLSEILIAELDVHLEDARAMASIGS